MLYCALFQLSTRIQSTTKIRRKLTFKSNRIDMLLCFTAFQCFVQCFVLTFNLDSFNNEDQKEVDDQE